MEGQPAIANRQEAWLCIVATLGAAIAVTTWWLPIVFPLSSSAGMLVAIPLIAGVEAILAWLFLARRVRLRLSDDPDDGASAFEHREVYKPHRWVRRMGIAWRVARTGQPSAETLALLQSEYASRDTVEAKRREIEQEMDRHP